MKPGTGARPSLELPRSREIIAFAVVGSLAMLVHFLVVSALVPLGLPPLIANVVAFLTAFSVSFLGHSRWSFPATGNARPLALRRFFVVAISSFAANETLYWLLLRFTDLDYRLALLLVLVLVAGSTLVLSKYWAFADAGR